MKFSYNWLRDLVERLDTPPHELAPAHHHQDRRVRRRREHGDDYVIEIDNKSLTHRPDLWGHYGMAREVAAILGRKLVDPVKPAQFPGSAPVRVVDRRPRAVPALLRAGVRERHGQAVARSGCSSGSKPSA